MEQHTLRQHLAVLALIILTGILYTLTIRGGHDWGGDFAQYIAHARSIAEGRAYSDIGYILNPHHLGIGPQNYPPLVPLLLAPVYSFYGLDLTAMKMVIIASFLILLAVFHLYCREQLESPLARFGAVATLAMSPWFWERKDQILSEIPFTVILFATFLLYDRYRKKFPDIGWRSLAPGIIMGVMAYLAYATRSVGLLLIPAVIGAELLRTRTLTRTAVITTLLFAALYPLHNAVFQTDTSYMENITDTFQKNIHRQEPESLNELQQPGTRFATGGTGMKSLPGSALELFISPAWAETHHSQQQSLTQQMGALATKWIETVKKHGDKYGRVLVGYWNNNTSKNLQFTMAFLTALLAVIGFLLLFFTRRSLGDVFALIYVVILLSVPFYQNKYLLPIIPLYILYLFRGAESIPHTRLPLGRNLVPLAVLCLVILSHGLWFSKQSVDDLRYGVEAPDSRELFTYIREQTPPDSVIIFKKPRVLALFADRRSATDFSTESIDQQWNYFQSIGARYIVVSHTDALTSRSALLDLIKQHRADLELVMRNEDFRLYRILNGSTTINSNG